MGWLAAGLAERGGPSPVGAIVPGPGPASGLAAAVAAGVGGTALLIAQMLVLSWIGLYPNLLPSNPNPEWSLTINNSYSSQFAMQVGLTWLAVAGVLALAHTSWVYYLFKGKVKLEAGSHY